MRVNVSKYRIQSDCLGMRFFFSQRALKTCAIFPVGFRQKRLISKISLQKTLATIPEWKGKGDKLPKIDPWEGRKNISGLIHIPGPQTPPSRPD